MKHVSLFKFFILVFVNILLFTYSEGFAASFEDKIIAIVNNEIITKSDIEDSKMFPNNSLSSLIEKKLQLQIAQKKGITTQDSELLSAIDDIKRANSFTSDKDFEDALLREGNSLYKYKKNLKDQLTILKIVNKEIKSKITISDKETEYYYLANKKQYLLPEEIKISYIYVPFKTSDPPEAVQRAQKKINDILSDLKKYNRSFSEIIKQYRDSLEVNINENSGYLKKGNLLKELEKVAFQIKEGETSDVISTPSGFYILKVLEKKAKDYKPLDEVKDEIKNILFQDKTEKTYKEWLYNLKISSYIEIM